MSEGKAFDPHNFARRCLVDAHNAIIYLAEEIEQSQVHAPDDECAHPEETATLSNREVTPPPPQALRELAEGFVESELRRKWEELEMQDDPALPVAWLNLLLDAYAPSEPRWDPSLYTSYEEFWEEFYTDFGWFGALAEWVIAAEEPEMPNELADPLILIYHHQAFFE